MPAPELILHHYDASPFSEKARLLFGVLGLPWRSVLQPNIMPKPDLTPLTGGYRRIPVLQIGADIYCDSQVIMAETAARAGRDLAAGGAWAVNLWADRLFFQASVPIFFAEMGDRLPPEFYADRAKMSGRAFDVAAATAAAVGLRGQWRGYASWIDDALAGTDFLGGEAPGLADVAAWMNVWWMRGAAPGAFEALTAGFERLHAWRARLRSIGHGARTEMMPAEALEVARLSQPAPYGDHDAADPLGLAPGAAVTVSADDYGRDPIAGSLVALNARRAVIAREGPDVGRLQVHFPRVGYVVASA